MLVVPARAPSSLGNLVEFLGCRLLREKLVTLLVIVESFKSVANILHRYCYQSESRNQARASTTRGM